jgi:integrase
MGSIIRDSRGRSPYFYLLYKTAEGKWVKKSARTSDRAKARLMLHGLETVEAAVADGCATEETIRQLTNEIIERITGKRPYNPSTQEFIDDWLARQRGTIEEKTFIRYAQVLRDFKETLGSLATQPLRRLNREIFTSHRERLLALGCSPATCNHSFKTLVDVFGDALKNRLIESNFAQLKALKAAKPGRVGFTCEQVQAILEATGKTSDEYGWVLVMALTGQRMGDVARLLWRQVNLETAVIRFHQKKGDKPLLMPMHLDVAELLLSRAGDDPEACVFPTLAKRRGPALSKLFTQLMDAARIDSPVVRERSGARGRTTRELSCHSLRHFFNSQLANGDVSQELRLKLTGHTSKAMNDVYTSLEVSTLRRAVESLPSIPSLHTH